MGAFNTLSMLITCERCRSGFAGRIQFKFGETWQLEYAVGDTIKWGRPEIGISGLPKVKVYGLLELSNCTTCGYKNSEEFDILIEKDVIKAAVPMLNYDDYLNSDGNYHIYP